MTDSLAHKPADDGFVLTTERLGLRRMVDADLPDLAAILQDSETMVAYEGPFSDEEVQRWLERMQERDRTDGFSMWAVQLDGAGPMIGQCGVTWQLVGDERVLEVGYLFNRAHWRRGYAIEAARACRDWAFRELGAERIHSIIRDTNIASMNVAIRNGMTVRRRFMKHYRGVDMPHLDFAIDRHTWQTLSEPRENAGEPAS
ncbi:MAG: GNAT family N-acetyltransferase [Tessaracoccus sp.]|uniref:GNAT family N-acetyltransferase n=1 Tax=Tessaracoccus sp. TaxID=1971211 RepID=UPI001EBECE9F|nr:GNAT family N-acetyltransferase [Tessaracoccus sp.]MBK7820895.1 GNAT family N-acetyltransferase [Tessaracoccus sp.]